MIYNSDKEKVNWKIKYGNDTGSFDAVITKWWVVGDNGKSFECYSIEDAKLLCDLMNRGDVGYQEFLNK